MEEYGIIYYFNYINEIGGIETFFYQLAKKYHDRDLTIIYQTGNEKQINRLREFVRVVQYSGNTIKCKQAFFNFNLDIIDKVIADEYILVVHGDYKDMIKRRQLSDIPKHPKITRIIGVSEIAANNYTELSNKKSEVSYNPIEVYEGKRPLMLLSATRLSSEKGFNRMKELCLELERQNINYIWFIFTNSPQEYLSDNVIYLSTRLDIEKYIKGFDYVIQLSDNEGYCYTLIESLSQGVPVICTPCPVFKELGFNSNNSIILEFDCSNVKEVVKKMTTKKFKFKYTPKEDRWGEILLDIKSEYYNDSHIHLKIKATNKYVEDGLKDAELNYIPKEGYEWETSRSRARYLEELGYVEILKEEE